MAESKIEKELEEFAVANNFKGKGSLAVALVITRKAIENGLPLDPDEFLTEAEGQVKGLGKAAVQNILKEYKITNVLAEEGGREDKYDGFHYVVPLYGVRNIKVRESP